MMCDLQGLCG